MGQERVACQNRETPHKLWSAGVPRSGPTEWVCFLAPYLQIHPRFSVLAVDNSQIPLSGPDLSPKFLAVHPTPTQHLHFTSFALVPPLLLPEPSAMPSLQSEWLQEAPPAMLPCSCSLTPRVCSKHKNWSGSVKIQVKPCPSPAQSPPMAPTPLGAKAKS